MKEQQRMGQLFAQGWSISAIAKELQIDRKTVRQYVYQEDYSATLPSTPVRASNLDAFKPIIQQWLADDARVRRKQRHTADRIHKRLQETFPDTYHSSYSTVQRYLKAVRAVRPQPSTGTLELAWEPGVAQVDFGEADAYWESDAGTLITVKYLTVSFPFSNAAVFQYFPGETAECVVEGLVTIAQWLGGMPVRMVFDNATGIGRRMGDVIQYAELFERFQAHYRFEATFCNPASGHEKGNVEANVGYLRRHLMVPPPVLGDWSQANPAALAAARHLWSRPHYKKGLPIAELFESDREALAALPARPFRAVRFTRVHTDGYGKFCLDHVHWYSSAPDWAHRELVVEIGAFTVVPYTPAGLPITTHARQYGTTRTDTVDPRTTLRRLSQNPGAFRNSPVRGLLPEALVGQLDRFARADLGECLKALADLSERFGFDHAQRALVAAVHANQISRSDILVRGTRMAYWEPTTDSTIDLRQYDEALLGVPRA